MLKTTWTIHAATMDDVCPEFDGWSEVYRNDNIIQVLNWLDVFCDKNGNTIIEHPQWRDRFPWKMEDQGISLMHDALTGLLLGRETPDGVYCLPEDMVLDFRVKASRMLDTVTQGFTAVPGESVEALANEIATDFLTWDDHCEAETEGLPDFFDPVLLSDYILEEE